MARPIVKASVNIETAGIARVRAALRARGQRIKKHTVTVGIHAEEGGSSAKIDYQGKPRAVSLLYVALAHEFGAGVPERAWFRSWFDTNANRLKLEMLTAKRAEYRGDESAVSRLAVKWAGEMRAWIARGQAHFVPLADRTVRARERAGLPGGPPLYATGQLVNAIRGYVDGVAVSA